MELFQVSRAMLAGVRLSANRCHRALFSAIGTSNPRPRYSPSPDRNKIPSLVQPRTPRRTLRTGLRGVYGYSPHDKSKLRRRRGRTAMRARIAERTRRSNQNLQRRRSPCSSSMRRTNCKCWFVECISPAHMSLYQARTYSFHRCDEVPPRRDAGTYEAGSPVSRHPRDQ